MLRIVANLQVAGTVANLAGKHCGSSVRVTQVLLDSLTIIPRWPPLILRADAPEPENYMLRIHPSSLNTSNSDLRELYFARDSWCVSVCKPAETGSRTIVTD